MWVTFATLLAAASLHAGDELTLHLRNVLKFPSSMLAVAVSGGTDSLVCLVGEPGDADKSLWLWDVSKAKPTHKMSVTFYGVAVASVDADSAVTGDVTGAVTIWDIGEGSPEKKLQAGAPVQHLAASGKGNVLAASCVDGQIRLWDLRKDTVKHVVDTSSGAVGPLALSENGRVLATGAGTSGDIQLWDVASGKPAGTLEGHSQSISSLAMSPDGSVLASGSYDRTVRLWRLPEGTLMHTTDPHEGNVWQVLFSPDGRFLVSGSEEKTRVFSVSTGEMIAALANRGMNIAFLSRSGQLAVGAGPDAGLDTTFKIFNLRINGD